MENDNVFNGTIGTVNNANVEITEATTLGELLSLIGEVKRADKIPSPKALRETAGNPLIENIDSKIYANGYAVYDNGSGRTVLWLPNCVSFTYHLNPLKESEKGGDIKETCMLPEGLLESQPWPIAVTLIGEHRIETLVHHRKSDRKESKTLIRGDNEEGDAMEDMEGQEDYPRDEYIWNEGRYGEDPLQYVLRKERQEEIREALTDKQWEVFVLYFREGFKQQQICEMLGISRNSVIDRLECAIKKYFKIPTKRAIPRLYIGGLKASGNMTMKNGRRAGRLWSFFKGGRAAERKVHETEDRTQDGVHLLTIKTGRQDRKGKAEKSEEQYP